MKKELQKALSSLGINEKQTSLYLACLELGSASIQELAQKSGIKRTSIYNFLKDQKFKELFSEIEESGKVLLVPQNPKMLVEKARKNLEEIKFALPELMSIFNLPSEKPRVRFYQGEEGIKTAYQDLLLEGKTVYGFSDYEKMFESMQHFDMWRIPKERVKRNIKFFCIAKNGPMGQEVKRKDKEELRETKLVENIQFETEINIYGNKVSLISFREPFACVIIEDPAISQTLKSVWQSWWNLL
ncbi:MAG: helix-turn-helix domain-containing protein [Candidatus Moraniibacteriota bacterium]